MTFVLGQRMVRITGIFQALLAVPVTTAAGSLALQALGFPPIKLYDFMSVLLLLRAAG